MIITILTIADEATELGFKLEKAVRRNVPE
jgi:hypothetical protein